MSDELDVAPFGMTDGAKAELDDFTKPSNFFGGIARDPADSRVRVVVGRLGAGKSIYLRKMHTAQRANSSIHTDEGPFVSVPSRNLSDLSSELIVRFHQTVARSGDNTELWKRIWRAAIFRSASTYLRCDSRLKSGIKESTLANIAQFSDLLGEPSGVRRVTFEAKNILTGFADSRTIKSYANDTRWSDAEDAVIAGLRESRPLFLYIDAIDDNFKYAPAHWMRCQRGLFYAVMDLIRGSDEENHLHVVVALRDIALATTRTSENASRYLDETHINPLSWDQDSIRELLRRKVQRLDSSFKMKDGNSVADWLGISEIRNTRPSAKSEKIEDYLIRHTRLVPRDVVALGNNLCNLIARSKGLGYDQEQHENQVREWVARSSFDFATNQLAQVSNQVWSEAMPSNAASLNMSGVYVSPNSHQIDHCQEAVIGAIGATKIELFGSDALENMNNLMSKAMDENVNLGNILWQNQLLGAVRTDSSGIHKATYYSLKDHARVSLPEYGNYVWNPIVFDCCPLLEPTLSHPLPPTE